MVERGLGLWVVDDNLGKFLFDPMDNKRPEVVWWDLLEEMVHEWVVLQGELVVLLAMDRRRNVIQERMAQSDRNSGTCPLNPLDNILRCNLDICLVSLVGTVARMCSRA